MTDDNNSGFLHDSSGGGIAGTHPAVPPFEDFVAPATARQSNLARLRLIPVACWRVDDIRFAFDSSFVTPDINLELLLLAGLREAHKTTDLLGHAAYPPLSVFGHADPVGNDDYNKALSGRRATAIYALLIAATESAKAVDLWEAIAVTENWGANQSQTMQASTGLPAGTPRISGGLSKQAVPLPVAALASGFSRARRQRRRQRRLSRMQ